MLFQDYHIPACYSQYPFFLHCGDDYGAEALRGHWGLDDVGVLPAGFVQNPEVVVYQNCPFAGFFCRGFALKIPPISLNLSRSSLSSRASDQTIGSVQLCLSATWETVKPLDKSAFIEFGSVAIFNKWL